MNPSNFKIDSIKVTQNGKDVTEEQLGSDSNAPKCECGQKATFFISQVNAYGKVANKAYCLLHAIQEGLLHPKAYDLLGGNNTLHHPEVKTCRCGCTVAKIKANGTVGCPECYKTFGAELRNYISTVQAGLVHDGKAPRKADPVMSVRRRIRQLQSSMDNAIRSESYEQAAIARDQIKQLQGLASSSGI